MTDLERIKKDVVEMDSRANVCWYDTKVLTKAVRLILEELTADRKTEPFAKDINVRSKTEPQTEHTPTNVETMSCQECKWWFTDSLKHGGYCQSLLYNHECRYEPEVDCSWK